MKLIDISHTLNENTPAYPGDYAFSLTKYRTLGEDGYNSYLLKTCLHIGTHVDFPLHMLDHDGTAASFDLDGFAGEGVLLDVRGESRIKMKPQYLREVPERSIVLLHTGFDEYYNEPRYFTKHPVLETELADFFISKKVKMVGMDTPSPDYEPFEIHKRLLSNGVFLLENLTNLNNLLDVCAFDVMALPLKIPAEASLVRAACLLR